MYTDLSIRTARPDDIGSISALWMRASLSCTTPLSFLIGDFIRLYIDEPRAVIRVAERQNRMVGVAFGHCWGSLGWLGPLAVAASERRAGIGRTLVNGVVQALQRCGCNAIALDSNGDERILVPFYKGLQFYPVEKTLSWVKGLAACQDGAHLWIGADEDADRFACGVQELCRTIANGMELLPVIELWQARAWGEGFLFQENGKAAALAVVMLRKRFIHESDGVVRLSVLVQRPELSAPRICGLLASAVRQKHPCARYLFVRDRADREEEWQQTGWSRQGVGQRWALQGLRWPLAEGLLSLE